MDQVSNDKQDSPAAPTAGENNRKRRMISSPTPVGGSALKRGNKFVRPAGTTPPMAQCPNAMASTSSFVAATGETTLANGAAPTPPLGYPNEDNFGASFYNAPTPGGPLHEMPPTPAVGNHLSGNMEDANGQSMASYETMPTPAPRAGQAPANAATNASQDPNKTHHTTPSAVPRATPLVLNNFANWDVTSRYTLVRFLGKGSYGHVAEAFDSVTQKKVAIKKILNVFDQEIDCKRLYREIYILRHLSHPQVIKLIDVVPPQSYDTFNDLYLVFDFLDTDLHKLIMSPQYLTIRHIQVFLYQILCGVKYLHSANVIHRDIKPANILLNEDCTLMLCDFGLSRVLEPELKMSELRQHLYSPKDAKSPTSDTGTTEPSPASASSTPSSNSGDAAPKFRRQLTKHVVTRWYRAPELILLQDYDFAVDMWSVGCIFAELLSMQVESCPRYQDRVPLFPGKSCFPLSADRPTTYSDKLDQLNVIFNVIGTPGEDDIGELGEVKQYLRKLSRKDPRDLRELFPGAPADSLDLLKKMLAFNPSSRITVDQALEHPFLAPVRRTQSESVEMKPLDMKFENVRLDKESLKGRIYEEVQMYAKRNERA